MLQSLNEIWDFNNAEISAIETSHTYTIKEDYLVEGSQAPEVDGKIILGKVVGPSFFGEGVSRNQRFYPRKLWERQLSLPVIKERLAARTMLGCIGHSEGPVTEGNITRGEVSHIITNLILREDNQGIAEILILNTPAGRNLYTLMKAGSRIKISTRAQGQFIEGQTHNGLPIVDPETFILETLDFVISPGFIETDPRLKESLDKITNRVNSIIESRNRTISSNNSSTKTIKESKGENIMEISEQLINEIRSASSVYKTMYEEQKKLREEAEAEKKEAEKEAEECKKELAKCEEALKTYKALGEAADISAMIEGYSNLGFSSPTEAEFILNQLQEEAEDAVKEEDVEDIKKDIEEAATKLAAYEALGSVEDLKAIREAAEELVDKLDKKEEDEVVERLSSKYKLPESLVRKFVETTEDEEEAEKEIEESLPTIPQGSDDDEIDDFENDHELPNQVNKNNVEVDPDVVEESLKKLVGSGRKVKNSMLEGYKPGSIASAMFD